MMHIQIRNTLLLLTIATTTVALIGCGASGKLNSDLLAGTGQEPAKLVQSDMLTGANFAHRRRSLFVHSFPALLAGPVNLTNGATLEGVFMALEQLGITLVDWEKYPTAVYTGPDLINAELLTALEIFASETGVDFVVSGKNELTASPVVTRSVPISADIFTRYSQEKILAFIGAAAARTVGDIKANVAIAAFNSTGDRIALRAPVSVYEPIKYMLTLSSIQPKFPPARIVKGTFKDNIERLATNYGFTPVIWEDHIKDCIWMQDTEYEIPYVDPMDIIAFYANATGFKVVFSNVDSHLQMIYASSSGKVRNCEQ
jgi:hypothetical protein